MTATASIFQIWNQDRWENLNLSLGLGTAFFLFLGAVMLLLRLTSNVAKDRDQDVIRDLRTALSKAQATQGFLSDRLQKWISLAQHIGQVVDAKLRRLASWAKDASPNESLASFMQAWNPDLQIRTILLSVHSYFATRLLAGDHKLRLALFTRDPRQPQKLLPIFSWDGQSENCLSDQIERFLRLDDPKGTDSILVKLFHSDSEIWIIQDCEAAARDPSSAFHFLHPDQRKYLRSLVAFKHLLAQGAQDVILISMDCSQPNFFSDADEDEILTVFREMMKRVEFELHAKDIVLNLPKGINEHRNTSPVSC